MLSASSASQNAAARLLSRTSPGRRVASRTLWAARSSGQPESARESRSSQWSPIVRSGSVTIRRGYDPQQVRDYLEQLASQGPFAPIVTPLLLPDPVPVDVRMRGAT